LLLVAFLLVNAPNCHLSLVLASVVQGDAVNFNHGWQLLVLANSTVESHFVFGFSAIALTES